MEVVYAWRGVLFFFNDTATTEIYTLSLHDALPISASVQAAKTAAGGAGMRREILSSRSVATCVSMRLVLPLRAGVAGDPKSTSLNSRHANISDALFFLKKKTTHPILSLHCSDHDRI